MITFSVIFYLAYVVAYFLSNKSGKLISTVISLMLSVFFAVWNMDNIFIMLIYVLLGIICLIVCGIIIPIYMLRNPFSSLYDIQLNSLKKKKIKIIFEENDHLSSASSNLVDYSNISLQSKNDKGIYNDASAKGVLEDFTVSINIAGNYFDFKVQNGNICEFRSANMRKFVSYEEKNDE